MELNCVKRRKWQALWPDEKRGKSEKREKNYFIKKERKSLPHPSYLGAGSPHFQKGPILATLSSCRQNTNDRHIGLKMRQSIYYYTYPESRCGI
jgi:hypothetical protein